MQFCHGRHWKIRGSRANKYHSAGHVSQSSSDNKIWISHGDGLQPPTARLEVKVKSFLG